MRDAEDQIPLAGKITVREQGEGHAGVGAAVFVPAHFAAVADNEAGEEGLAVTERETPRAGIGDIGQGA